MWILTNTKKEVGILFDKFQAVTVNVCHSFTLILMGKGLLLLFNAILWMEPGQDFLHCCLDIVEVL